MKDLSQWWREKQKRRREARQLWYRYLDWQWSPAQTAYMSEMNSILDDLTFIDYDKPINIRTTLPQAKWRKINQSKPL